MPVPDATTCYRAVQSRDARFDGVFYTAVHTTGIYCRPSCPARTPHRGNVSFHATAAAAQAAGFRACRRCLPDATPGSPEWDLRADVAGRAMRLIYDGVVDREGVTGLASRLGYSPRHLGRVLAEELGAGPIALARARRAQQARVLLERTRWPASEVAYASGFASVRQFNDTIREVFAATPKDLRGRGPARPSGAGAQCAPYSRGDALRLVLRLPVRTPFDGPALWRFLDAHLAPGVEGTGPGWYLRSLRLPHGPATVRVDLSARVPVAGRVLGVPTVLQLTDVRDLAAATERCRRLLDADCDPVAVDGALGDDPLLGRLVAERPGLRVTGHVEGAELALRTVLGQQVSVRAGNRLAGELVARWGRPLPASLAADGVTRVFPTPEELAGEDLAVLPVPASRVRALDGLVAALAAGDLALDRSADRAETRRRILEVPGLGPWTADLVAMRALGDPDVFPAADAFLRRALGSCPGPGRGGPPAAPDRWRPWRSYAAAHLWHGALPDPPPRDAAAPPPSRARHPDRRRSGFDEEGAT